MIVQVLAFARVREILGGAQRTLELASGARACDAWAALAAQEPALQSLSASTRIARNGRVVADDEPLEEGDQLALLPPTGGG